MKATTPTEFDHEIFAFAAIAWEPDFTEVEAAAASTTEAQFSRFPPARKELRCPSCGSVVYSRRHRLCGACSQPLPEEFLFSATESRRIESLMEAERRRHREWLAKSFRPRL